MSATVQEPLARLEAVSGDQEFAHHATVAERVRAEQRKRERRQTMLKASCVLLALAAPTGWIRHYTNPIVKEVPRFIPLMPDGTVVSAVRYENLPLRDQNKLVVNSAWTYVRAREGYSRIGAAYAWNVVNAMSTDEVQREYFRTDHYTQATSPWVRYGEKTRVEVAYESYRALCDGTDCGTSDRPTGIEFRFKRQEITDGVAGPVRLYVSEMRFRTNDPDMDPDLVATSNGAGLRTTYYRPGQPVGAQSGGR